MRSHWSRAGRQSGVNDVLIKRGDSNTETNANMGGMPCDRKRDQGCASTHGGTPESPSTHRKR